ncbi:hypothetical protein [Streptomyces echinatus]|uniref:hypothetical protein n=1 Tax=Streptomyces echinatus TaxID=67293 RepID=UPI00381B0F6F
MARAPQPRRITLGGHEAVALTPQEYEQLVASRRQIGGQSARVRVLSLQAKRTAQLLHELETLIETRGDACQDPAHVPSTTCAGAGVTPGHADTVCLRCAVAALLRRHRDAAT